MHTVFCFRTKVGSTGISATYPTILFGASSPAQPLLGPLESQKLRKMHRLHVGMPKNIKKMHDGAMQECMGDIGHRLEIFTLPAVGTFTNGGISEFDKEVCNPAELF